MRVSTRRCLSSLVLVVLAACGGGDRVAPRVATSLSIDQQVLSLEVGDFTFLTATIYDQHDVAMAGEPVNWHSTNPTVATVTAGMVEAWGPGTAAIIASAANLTATASVTVTIPQVTIVLTNQLLRPVNVDVNGSVIGSVPAGETRQQTIPSAPSIVVGWTVIPFVLNSGQPIGDVMSGVYSPIFNPTGTLSFTANYQIGTQRYFTPVIDNNTSVELLMGVNMGLQSENRCNCAVRPFGTNVAIGYYRLFSNSNVRAYRVANGYSGPYIFWPAAGVIIPDLVTPGSGETHLQTSIAPVSGRQPGLVQSLIQAAPPPAASGPEDEARPGRLMPQAPVLPLVERAPGH